MPNFDYLWKFWNIYTYPWRPNNIFIKVINKYIINEKMNILILWSTKEFRDEYKNHNITVCDISENMIKNNSVWNDNEKILLTNWLYLDNKKYDLILWDLIFFLFDNNDKKLLFKKIKSKLNVNGKFIFRTSFKKDEYNEELLLKNISNITSNILKFNYLTFELVVGENYKSDMIYNFLINYDILLANKFKIFFYKFTPYNTSKISIENKDNFDILLENFDINEIIYKSFVMCDEYIYIISSKHD